MGFAKFQLFNGSALRINSISSGSPTMSDVPSTSWAHDAIEYCLRYGIIDYRPADMVNFKPNSTITRMEYINALYQIAGSPNVNPSKIAAADSAFPDIRNTRYHEALVWAISNGILNGTGASAASPAGTLTREQSACFLHRYYNICLNDALQNEKNMVYSPYSGHPLDFFLDANNVSSWARADVSWATEKGLLQGNNRILNPNGEEGK